MTLCVVYSENLLNDTKKLCTPVNQLLNIVDLLINCISIRHSSFLCKIIQLDEKSKMKSNEDEWCQITASADLQISKIEKKPCSLLRHNCAVAQEIWDSQIDQNLEIILHSNSSNIEEQS